MSEVLSPTDESVTTVNVVYRNQARVLFEEAEVPPDEQRRTRVSARFDRTHWQPETYHSFEVTRSQYAPKTVNTAYNNSNFGKGAKVYQGGHTREALEALPMHGTYKLLEVKSTDCGKGLIVKAQCTGGGCRGEYHRSFRSRDWLDLEQYQSCTLCKGWRMALESEERYRATVNATHGSWVFESMSRMHDNKVMTVTGVCTGPACGGWKRNFQFNHWQGTKAAMHGCHRCCEAVREAANDIVAEKVAV